MKFLICATHAEAAPIIKRFRLKKDLTSSAFQYFHRDDTALIVSGIGKVRAAAATAQLLSRAEDLKRSVAFNIGICGARNSHPVGQAYLVSSIADASSGRQFFSDLILRHSIAEASLTTFDRGVYSDVDLAPGSDLADMEASGFFEAATHYLGPAQIFCLKVVSDHLVDAKIDPKSATDLIELNLDLLVDCLTSIFNFHQKTDAILGDEDLALLSELGSSLQLTKQQRIQLENAARSFSVLQSDNLDLIKEFRNQHPSSKQERNELFEQLREKLTAS